MRTHPCQRGYRGISVTRRETGQRVGGVALSFYMLAGSCRKNVDDSYLVAGVCRQ